MASPLIVSSKIPRRYYLALILVTFLVYSPVLSHDFVRTWDDNTYVLENPLVRSLSPSNLRDIFTTAPNKVYTPLTLLSFAVEYRFFGFTAWVYHINNLLLHVMIAALLLRLGGQLGLSAAAASLSALMFALHPVHVESVAWVSERKDVLYALFYMLALCAYVEYLHSGKRNRFFLSVVFGLLSMLAKPMALSLPLLLLLLDWFLQRPLNWTGRIKEKIYYFLYIIPLTFFSAWWLDRIQNDWLQRLLVWLYSFVFYVEKLMTPWTLLPHYELPKPVVAAHPAYLGAAGLFLIIVYSLVRFRNSRWYIFAWAYYFLSIFFMLRVHNVMEMSTANFSQVADRFMYLPMMGFCLWLGAALEDLSKKTGRQPGAVILILAMSLLGLQTFRQTMIWKNDVTLWSYAAAQNPRDPLAYVNRASAYERRGDHLRAIEEYSKAMAIDPQYYVSELTPGTPGTPGDRINERLANNPYYFLALRQRGCLYQLAGERQKALADFNEVLRINPGDTDIAQRRRQTLDSL